MGKAQVPLELLMSVEVSVSKQQKQSIFSGTLNLQTSLTKCKNFFSNNF